MGKKRIHELAKELSLSNADLIQKIYDWKLMPGRELTASNGLEDYLVEEIKRRLNSGGGDPSSAPQIVRRRKKVMADAADGVADESVSPVAENSEEAPEASSVAEPAPEAAPQPRPVTVRPPKSESAKIIAPAPSPSQFKDSQVKKNVPAIAEKKQLVPDFKKLVPTPPLTQERPVAALAGEVTAEKTEAPAAPVPERSEATARPMAAPARAEKPAAPPRAPEAQARRPEAQAAPAPRKVTREIGDAPAKIISPPRNFDAAKVVGSKPNWKDAQGGGGRPGGPGSRPGGPGGGAPRRPAGEGREGGGEWRDRRPGGAGDGGRPTGGAPRTPDFRRVEPAAAPLPESDTTRRRDKKKKTTGGGGGARFDNDEGQNKNRRREVERTDLYSEGDWERVRRRGKNTKKNLKAKPEATVPKAIKRRIKVDEAVTVSELAHRLSIKAGDIIKKLMAMGVLANVNQSLDFDTASIVASEFGYEVERSSFDEENILHLEYGDASPEVTRPPVVTIMGHVDHGKTSLLDYIRKTNIQSGEAGGITQHIGAYHVRAGGRNITFLDTPGHEAFTSMRSRGAQVTDIVILIVAADDGLMPQTREAADHAKAAGVPIIVAINKIDKPAADPERVRREMMEIGLVAEAWGGDTVFVEISAKTGQGVPELLDMILLQADILDLKARPDGQAKGRIIEARLDKGRGPVATVLVQEGMLKQGDTYVCGVFYGRIRAMFDDQGQRVTEAGPAIPVEVQGISGVPQAGDEFIALEDEKQARQVSQHRLLRQRESELTKTSKLTLENLFDNIRAGAVKALNLIVKTDVQGSLEAIVDSVSKFSTPEIKINVIHQSTGAVSETDILLASASNALIICFGVRPPSKVQEMAEAEHIQIRYYDVIYKLMDDIKEAMAGMLAPVRSEKVLGRAEVRATFVVSKVGTIAGSYVLDGKIVRGARARLLRDGLVIHDGKLSSLKRIKDDAKEVLSGYECGIGFESYNDIKIGDHIEAYQVEETAATVELIDEALAKVARDKEKADKEKAGLSPAPTDA